MKRNLGVLALFLIHQGNASAPVNLAAEKWAGVWVLNVAESKFEPVLFPGAPRDLEILGQELRIEAGDATIRLSGNTSIKTAGQFVLQKDDNILRLDGAETRVGPTVFVLHPIDAYIFEIISSVKQADRKYQEISRFQFSSDRTALRETKTQMEKLVSGDTALKSSTSVLLFSRKS